LRVLHITPHNSEGVAYIMDADTNEISGEVQGEQPLLVVRSTGPSHASAKASLAILILVGVSVTAFILVLHNAGSISTSDYHRYLAFSVGVVAVFSLFGVAFQNLVPDRRVELFDDRIRLHVRRFGRDTDVTVGLDPSVLVDARCRRRGKDWSIALVVRGGDARIVVDEREAWERRDVASLLDALAEGRDLEHGEGLERFMRSKWYAQWKKNHGERTSNRQIF